MSGERCDYDDGGHGVPAEFPWARGSYCFWFLCSLRFCEQVPVGFCDHDVVYVECCAADALALRSGCGGGAAGESWLSHRSHSESKALRP